MTASREIGGTPGHLVLLGPMGSGKSTVGRILAERLGRPFIDSDAQIEERYGSTAKAFAADRGVALLHAAEAQALRDGLGHEQPAVIAAAASTGDLPDIADLIGGSDVSAVLLVGDPEHLAARASGAAHRRPMSLSRFDELANRRNARLAPVVDVTVDVTALPPDQVADAIMAHQRHPPDGTG